MSLKNFLIAMTMVAVVSDYLLHPFYPQFFETRFGETDPKVVGNYFAAICFMVMLAFPFWAYVSKRVQELRILVYTQLVAGLLALYCFWTTSYVNFWAASLIMVCFKGSYLLVYPFILRIIQADEHEKTIGILSVVVHLGGIMGAVIGGLIVDWVNPAYIFLVMAAGDFIQMFMSMYLLRKKDPAITIHPTEEENTQKQSFFPTGFVLKIGLVTLILYFSDFLIRPFFSRYWEYVSEFDSKFTSGAVYAIPGFIAIFALWWNSKRPPQATISKQIITALLLGTVGLLLQAVPYGAVVICGRIVYGWAIFQGTVQFDALLFKMSSPENYAIDYSKVHFFQNLGVLLASFTAGILVDLKGLQIPFATAFLGFVLSLAVYFVFFRVSLKTAKLQAKP